MSVYVNNIDIAAFITAAGVSLPYAFQWAGWSDDRRIQWVREHLPNATIPGLDLTRRTRSSSRVPGAFQDATDTTVDLGASPFTEVKKKIKAAKKTIVATTGGGAPSRPPSNCTSLAPSRAVSPTTREEFPTLPEGAVVVSPPRPGPLLTRQSFPLAHTRPASPPATRQAPRTPPPGPRQNHDCHGPLHHGHPNPCPSAFGL